MCLRCEAAETDLMQYVQKHQASNCNATGCPVPHGAEYGGTHFWLLALVYSRLSLIQERMEKSKFLVDNPTDLPASILEDWEQHAIEAAEMLGRCRNMKQKADEATRAITTKGTVQ